MRIADRSRADRSIDGPSSPAVAGDSALAVGAVARRLGVAAPTLRSWERRYGLKPSGRSAGGHRRYTTADVARLQAVLQLVNRGVPTAAAAEAVRGGLLPLVAEGRRGSGPKTTAGTPAALLPSLLDLAHRLDVLRLQELVDEALVLSGAVPVWTDLLAPLLKAIDDGYHGGGRSLVVEHLTVELVAGCLHRHTGRVWSEQPPDPGARSVLLVTLADEAHTVPLLAVAAGLAERRVLGRVLGAGLPSSAISAAVGLARPAALFVWSSASRTADAESLAALTRTRPRYPIVVGGPGWAGVDTGRRVLRAATLAEATDLLAG